VELTHSLRVGERITKAARGSLMKKLIIVLSLLVSVPSWAKWTYYSEHEDAKFYMDISTIRKELNIRKVWTISNYKEKTKLGVLSVRARMEFDCKNERYKMLSVSTHSEPMASGETLQSVVPSSEYREIPPDTPNSDLLGILCSIK